MLPFLQTIALCVLAAFTLSNAQALTGSGRSDFLNFDASGAASPPPGL